MIDVPERGSLLTEGISIVAAGVSSVLASVIGFFLLRTIHQLDAKADASALRSVTRKYDDLRDKYDALLLRTLGIEKDLAVMVANNAGRDSKIDDVRADIGGVDKKIERLLMRTPDRGIPRPT